MKMNKKKNLGMFYADVLISGENKGMQLKFSRLFPGEMSLLHVMVASTERVIELLGKYIPSLAIKQLAPHVGRKKTGSM